MPAAISKAQRDKINERRRNSWKEVRNRTKKQAFDRNLVWGLTDAEAQALIQGMCGYCGTAAAPVHTIDRLDNDRGYLSGNVVSACKHCNLAKACLDPATFIERCRHISCMHGGPGELHPDIWHDTNPKGATYRIYKKNASFGVTLEQFDTITSAPCFYCGKQNSATHKNGIDRVDSAVGYVVDNCVSCCGQCNIAKKTMAPTEYIDLAKRVAARDHPSHSHIPRQLAIIKKRTPNKVPTKCKCGRNATYRDPDGSLRWCRVCARTHPEATTKMQRKCKVCGKKVPAFGLPGTTKALWCGTCAQVLGGVNVISSMCQVCEKSRASYGEPGTKTKIWCAPCGRERGGVDVANKMCEECGLVQANHGDHTQDLVCHVRKEERRSQRRDQAVRRLPGAIHRRDEYQKSTARVFWN